MSSAGQGSISVIFPAYNEEQNITRAIEQATVCLARLVQDWEIIVVNDGSQDKTGDIIDRLASHDTRLTVVHHPANRGYGATLQSGIHRACKDLIFFSDADLQFNLMELPLLLMWIEQYDVVIGFRAKRRDALYRRLNALGWHVLVRLLLGLKVRDINCAFKLFRRVVLRTLKIDAIGAMVNTDILVQATRMGFQIKEVPVTHFPRLYGTQTGANPKVIFRALQELLRLYGKLRSIRPIVMSYDRRQHQQPLAFKDRRRAERRRERLPINFPDRRQRFLRIDGSDIPMDVADRLKTLID